MLLYKTFYQMFVYQSSQIDIDFIITNQFYFYLLLHLFFTVVSLNELYFLDYE